MSACFCRAPRGHYSAVTYKPLDDPQNPVTETYWFCHSCAKIVYETDAEFIPEEK